MQLYLNFYKTRRTIYSSLQKCPTIIQNVYQNFQSWKRNSISKYSAPNQIIRLTKLGLEHNIKRFTFTQRAKRVRSTQKGKTKQSTIENKNIERFTSTQSTKYVLSTREAHSETRETYSNNCIRVRHKRNNSIESCAQLHALEHRNSP